MIDELEDLRATLMSAIRLSMQGSYSRRAPAKSSVPYLMEARNGLRELLEREPNFAEAWELLSRAEECLLNYRQAISCLEKAMSLTGKRDKRSLKRLAQLRGSLSEWSSLPLTSVQLRDLGAYLVDHRASEEKYGRTLDSTRQWLDEQGFTNAEEIIEGLRNRGGYTDFTILYNVVRG